MILSEVVEESVRMRAGRVQRKGLDVGIREFWEVWNRAS